jgi:Protein of unknown function (DUF1552)
MNLRRRQLLQALGLGALSSVGLPTLARGDNSPSPLRIVFFVTPHGLVPKGWQAGPEVSPTSSKVESVPLAGLRSEEFKTSLRPLHPFRDRLLILDGLARTSALHDIAIIAKTGGDLNNHQIGMAHVLTGARALQRSGSPAIGGARSIDQELGARTYAPGRFASRVYGFDYGPNGPLLPFSFLGAGQAAPKVASPATALADLLGYRRETPNGTELSRESRIAQLRPQVLDAVGREYAALAPRLGAEGQKKLLEHAALVRELQNSLGAGPSAKCDLSFAETGHVATQFMRLTKLALACDLTRVVTFVAPVVEPAELGFSSTESTHALAHQSVEGATSCGTRFSADAEQTLIALNTWYANQFATLLRELDGVAEGTGTLLDHTLVVWTSELATPTHEHHRTCTVVAGGGNGFFNMGQYVRYPGTFENPLADMPRLGPGHNRLLVSLLQAFGQPDTSFGLTEAFGHAGARISLTGALTELHRG